jgi:ferric-dicitrate binding protein FerR (iron transport regulator)
MKEERNSSERQKWQWLINLQAILWYVDLKDDSLSMKEWDAFENWLFVDPHHLAAYEALEDLCRDARKLNWTKALNSRDGPS